MIIRKATVFVLAPFGNTSLPCEIISRGGTKSPHMVIIKYKNRIITPYEQHKRKWIIGFDSLFILYYAAAIKNVMLTENKFMKFVKPEWRSNGKYISIPENVVPKPFQNTSKERDRGK